LGAGNNGRYLAFLCSTNLVVGPGSGSYTTWASLFNTYGVSASSPRYFGHGLLLKTAQQSYYIGAVDSSAGRNWTSSPLTAYFQNYTNAGIVSFIVGQFTFTPGGSAKDTNSVWVNPPISSFGGLTPSTNAVHVFPMSTVMSDVGGLALIDRVGNGALGGVGTNVIANLLIGTTWSYVTGGPEFTNQPVSVNTTLGGTASLNADAVAAGQSVTYQWQHIVGGVTNNVSNGPHGAGGGATISGATTRTLIMTGVSAADSGGVYQLMATASGTGFSLASSTAAVNTDPVITSQPQPAQANFGGQAALSVSVTSLSSTLTYAWYKGATPLANGLQASGSTVSGAAATVSGGLNNITLTLSNLSYLDQGSYSLFVTNNANNGLFSPGAQLTVHDPYIVIQPADSSAVPGTSANLAVVAGGSPTLNYQWKLGGTNFSDGLSPDGSTISGARTANLTISGFSTNDAGGYSATVSGSASGQSVDSATASLVPAFPVVITQPPQSRTERAGDHLAFVVAAAGGGLVYQWEFNGTNISGATSSILALTNIQTVNQGTYTVVVTNGASATNASAALTVITSPVLPVASSNLAVVRIGDGAQALSGATGNTVYLDQYTTNGAYVSTIQVPDEGTGLPYGAGSSRTTDLPFGSQALLLAGVGADAPYEGFLTLSADGASLNFAGYIQGYPYSGADVTASSGNGQSDWRGIGSINLNGYYSVVWTNTGLYSGGNHNVRSAVTFDQQNYWTSGSAGSGGIKSLNISTQPASGSGLSSLGGSASGTRIVQIINGNLAFSDLNGAGTGIYTCSGAVGAFGPYLLIPETNSPMDFAASPDNATIYIADNGTFGGANAQTGGIQRWDTDTVNGGYAFSYTLATGSGSTTGTRGLNALFPASITNWGAGVMGATLWATTAESSGNRLISLVDHGPNSTASILATATAREIFSGVRFGPSVLAPVSIWSGLQAKSALAGQTVTFSIRALGGGPISYQWQFNGTNISGATQGQLTLVGVTLAQAGDYSVNISNAVSVASSALAHLTVDPLPTFSSSIYLGPLAGFQLNFIGPAGYSYSIWTSTNLNLRPLKSTWTQLITGSAFSGAAEQFVAPISGTNSQQYYIITVP
jgi:hypothetical protein